jgi:hypothetical protein
MAKRPETVHVVLYHHPRYQLIQAIFKSRKAARAFIKSEEIRVEAAVQRISAHFGQKVPPKLDGYYDVVSFPVQP